MADDEIQEIRAIRHAISAEHDHDVRKLVASLQKLENELRQSGKFRFASDVQKLGNAKTPKRQTTGKKRRVRS